MAFKSVYPVGIDIRNDEKLKCGEIYIRTSGIISLACGFCEVNEFFTLDAYSNHFKCHFQSQKRPAPIIKLEFEPHISQPTSQDTDSYAIIENQLNVVDPLRSETLTFTSQQTGITDFLQEVIIKDEMNVEHSVPPALHYYTSNSEKTNRLKEKCNHCDEMFESIPEFRKHSWKVHKIGYYICHFCDKQFYDRSTLYNHEKIQHGREPTPKHDKLICDICSEVTTTRNAFVRHKWRAHLIGVRCRHCEKHFSTEHSRNEHEKIHTGEPRRIKKRKINEIACNCKDPDCQKHYRRGTPQRRQPNKCKHCDEVFIYVRVLRKHLWTAHKTGNKCRFCEKQFYDRSNRDTHERTHTGQQPFKCTHCPRTFSAHTTMKHHIMLHENDLPFLCTTCGKGFVSVTRLNCHVREKHPSPDSENQKDRFPCLVCGKRFSKNYILKNHNERYHNTGEAVILTCDICQRTFNTRKCLVQHMKIHSGKKPYKCRYCGMAFAQSAGKRGHERNKHENIVI